jgi:hypothetical protein
MQRRRATGKNTHQWRGPLNAMTLIGWRLSPPPFQGGFPRRILIATPVYHSLAGTVHHTLRGDDGSCPTSCRQTC